jgi:hypothetical protein
MPSADRNLSRSLGTLNDVAGIHQRVCLGIEKFRGYTGSTHREPRSVSIVNVNYEEMMMGRNGNAYFST